MEQSIEIGLRIQSERKRLRLSQEDFGLKTGVSRAAQTSYEGGRSTPDLIWAVKAVALGLNLEFVLSGRNQKESGFEGFDWELAAELMAAMHTVSSEMGMSVPPEKVMPLLKLLYRLSLGDGTATPNLETAREVLKLAA